MFICVGFESILIMKMGLILFVFLWLILLFIWRLSTLLKLITMLWLSFMLFHLRYLRKLIRLIMLLFYIIMLWKIKRTFFVLFWCWRMRGLLSFWIKTYLLLLILLYLEFFLWTLLLRKRIFLSMNRLNFPL